MTNEEIESLNEKLRNAMSHIATLEVEIYRQNKENGVLRDEVKNLKKVLMRVFKAPQTDHNEMDCSDWAKEILNIVEKPPKIVKYLNNKIVQE